MTQSIKKFLRMKYSLPVNAYLIGSFVRDTEGKEISRGVFLPKLEKGPDLFCEFVNKQSLIRSDVHVVLAGWRRQYVIRRLEDLRIPYTYFDLPPHETLNELYQTLDVYPVTARHEGGPQSLIECGLLGVPVVSRPVGIAEQVLPSTAIADDVLDATAAIPNIESWKLPLGYSPYRRLIEEI